jgi:AhpD family alkylhydroperoxidase
MMDWNAYRGQINTGVRSFGQLSPDTVRGYLALNSAGQATSQFGDKMRELIAVAVAITLRCDGCIAVHTEAALKFGATPADLAEAMGVAISVNAGAAIIYATRSLDAFAAAEEARAD